MTGQVGLTSTTKLDLDNYFKCRPIMELFLFFFFCFVFDDSESCWVTNAERLIDESAIFGKAIPGRMRRGENRVGRI